MNKFMYVFLLPLTIVGCALSSWQPLNNASTSDVLAPGIVTVRVWVEGTATNLDSQPQTLTVELVRNFTLPTIDNTKYFLIQPKQTIYIDFYYDYPNVAGGSAWEEDVFLGSTGTNIIEVDQMSMQVMEN